MKDEYSTRLNTVRTSHVANLPKIRIFYNHKYLTFSKKLLKSGSCVENQISPKLLIDLYLGSCLLKIKSCKFNVAVPIIHHLTCYYLYMIFTEIL